MWLLKDMEEIQLLLLMKLIIIALAGIDQNPVCTYLFCNESSTNINHIYR